MTTYPRRTATSLAVIPLLLLIIFANSRSLMAASPFSPPFKITELKLCQEVDKDRNPVKITTEFPAGTNTVYAWFAWKDAERGLKITAHWHYTTENIAILDFSVALNRSADHGVIMLRMGEGKTLPAGSYRLDIEVDSKVIKSISFTALPPESR